MIKINRSKNKILRIGDLVQWAPPVNSRRNEIGIVLEFIGPDIKRQQVLNVVICFPSGIKKQYLPTTNIEEKHFPFIII